MEKGKCQNEKLGETVFKGAKLKSFQ